MNVADMPAVLAVTRSASPPAISPAVSAWERKEWMVALTSLVAVARTDS